MEVGAQRLHRPWLGERDLGALTAGCDENSAAVVAIFWLQLLSRLFPNARTSAAQLVSKVFVNQLAMSPGLNGGFFAFVIWTRTAPRMRMNASKWSQLVDKYRRDLLPTIVRSCLFWSVVAVVLTRLRLHVHLREGLAACGGWGT